MVECRENQASFSGNVVKAFAVRRSLCLLQEGTFFFQIRLENVCSESHVTLCNNYISPHMQIIDIHFLVFMVTMY